MKPMPLAVSLVAVVLPFADSAHAVQLQCTTLSHVRSTAEGRIEDADPADPFAVTWQTFTFDTATLTLTHVLPDNGPFLQKLQKGLLSASEFAGIFRIGSSPIGMLHISLSRTPMTFSLSRTRDFLSGVCQPVEVGPA